MSIQKIETYTLKCDRCGNLQLSKDGKVVLSVKSSRDYPRLHYSWGWKLGHKKNRHYCPVCLQILHSLKFGVCIRILKAKFFYNRRGKDMNTVNLKEKLTDLRERVRTRILPLSEEDYESQIETTQKKIESLKEEKDFKTIALTEDFWFARLSAIPNISDQGLLSMLVLKETDAEVREAIQIRINYLDEKEKGKVVKVEKKTK